MLTLEAILMATKQMTAYGETPAPTSGRVPRRRSNRGQVPEYTHNGIATREWDDELKVYRHRQVGSMVGPTKP
jgi:hypothetical protein